MTFVGKILVGLITAFALLFLGISTVVFTANTNWKQATAKEKEKVGALTKTLADANGAKEAAEKAVEQAKGEHKLRTDELNNQITQLTAQAKTSQDQATQAQNALGLTQKNMQLALDEATAKKAETDTLREQKGEVEKQANAFKLKQTELLDKIRELERLLETARSNEKDLRDRAARLSTLLRRHSISDDVSAVNATDAPPPVEGQVKRVDKGNSTLELSIGSDDGLAAGHELFLFRTHPRPEYLGKIRILNVDSDQSVAKVIKGTISGKKVQEGDIVSSTLRPRS